LEFIIRSREGGLNAAAGLKAGPTKMF